MEDCRQTLFKTIKRAALWLAIGLVSSSALYADTHAPWLDSANGLAIGGYDPVAYFTHASPQRGTGDHEANWNKATWRFVNSGNRAAFIRNPEIYSPQFSGYDAYAISQGHSTRGHPAIWAIRNKRLYLFYSPTNRRLWMRQPDEVVKRARAVWQRLSKTIPGYVAYGEPTTHNR